MKEEFQQQNIASTQKLTWGATEGREDVEEEYGLGKYAGFEDEGGIIRADVDREEAGCWFE